MSQFTAAAMAVVLGLLITACGSAAGTPSASAGAALNTPIPSSSLPAASGSTELEALIPDKVGTITLQKASMSGEQFVGSGGASQEAQDFLQGLGVSADDVSVAVGFGTDLASTGTVAILLFRAQGASSDRLVNLFKQAADRDRDNPLDWQSASVGGKQVERAADPEQGTGSGSIYLYATGDLLAFVTAGNDDTAAEALSRLP